MKGRRSRLSRMVQWAKRHTATKWLVMPLLVAGYGAAALLEAVTGGARRLRLWFTSPYLSTRATALVLALLVLLYSVPLAAAQAMDETQSEALVLPEEDGGTSDVSEPGSDSSAPPADSSMPESAPDASGTEDPSDAPAEDSSTPPNDTSTPAEDDSSGDASEPSDASDVPDSSMPEADSSLPEDGSLPTGDDSDPAEAETPGDADSSVPEAPAPLSIAGFVPLVPEVALQEAPVGTEREALALPETLDAFVAENAADTSGGLGAATPLPVAEWTAQPGYDPDAPGEYRFTPGFAPHILLAEGLEAPSVVVTLVEEDAPEAQLEDEEAPDGLAESWADLAAEIADISGMGEVVLSASFDNAGATEPITIPAGVTVTLEGGGHAIGHASADIPSGTANLFSVAGTLVLQNITLDGGAETASGDMVNVASTGALSISDGAVLQNTTQNAVYSTGAVTMAAGQMAGIAGSALVLTGGSATGTVTGGSIAADAANVVVQLGAQFELGGIASLVPGAANTAGAIQMQSAATTTISGGTISGFALSSGGAVYATAGTLNITGGAISGNQLSGAAADVYLSGSTVVNLSGAPTVGDGASGARSGFNLTGTPINVQGALSAAVLWFNAPSTTGVTVASRGTAFTADELDCFFTTGGYLPQGSTGSAPFTVSFQLMTLQQRINLAGHGTPEDPALVTLYSNDLVTFPALLVIADTDSGNAARHILLDGAGLTIKRTLLQTAALINVPGGSSLTLRNITLNGYRDGMSATESTVTVDDNATLNLRDRAVLTNNFKSGLLVAAGGTVNMYAGTISNNESRANGYGGGVTNRGTFNMYGGAIERNLIQITAIGGGVYNTGTFNLYGGTIGSDNAANGNTALTAGGVYNNGTFVMDGAAAAIKNNRTTTGGGGGVYNAGSGTFTLRSGAITQNQATGAGGGVYNAGSAIFRLDGDTALVGDNTSSSYGGGIYATGAAGQVELLSGKVTGNTGNRFGGGLFLDGAVLNMAAGSITGNMLTGDTTRGGGLHIQGATGAFSMAGGAITGNTATLGGGISTDQGAALSFTSSVQVQGNTATGTGKDILLAGNTGSTYSSLTLSGTPLIGTVDAGGLYVDNAANSLSIGQTLTEGALVVYEGFQQANQGVVANKATEVESTDLAAFRFMNPDLLPIADNASTPAYIKIRDTSGLALQQRINLAAAGTSTAPYPIALKQNEALEATLIIADTSNGNAPRHVQLSANSITRGGADGVMVSVPGGSSLTLRGIVLDGSGTASGAIVQVAAGAALTVNAGAVLKNNTAGGVVVDANGSFTMAGGEISGNSTAQSGGGVANAGTFVHSGGVIEGNTAALNGGGVYNTGTYTLSGGSVTGNTASNSVYIHGGGGVYNTRVFQMTDGAILDNKASAGSGGGLNSQGYSSVATLSGGRIGAAGQGNTALRGGGVYASFGQLSISGSANITGNTGSSNYGGVMLGPDLSAFTLSGGNISGNSTPGNGGGLGSFINGGTVSITGGAITGNTAGQNGGAIWLTNSPTGGVTLTDVTISGNTAGLNGGGICAEMASLTLGDGTQITGNTATASGGGVYVLSSTTLNGAVIGSTASPNVAATGAGVYITAGRSVRLADDAASFGGGNGFYLANATAQLVVAAALDSATVPFEHLAFAQATSLVPVAAADASDYPVLTGADLAAFTARGYTFSLGGENTQVLVQLDTYTVTYQNMTGATNHANNPESFTVHDEAYALYAPTRAGWQFDGWYDNALFTGSAVTGIPAHSVGNITLYAKWLQLFTVSFHANAPEGVPTGMPSNQTKVEGSSVTIPTPGPTLTNYRFDGWSLTETGGKAYDAGATITNLQADIPLYARWVRQYTLRFAANGDGASAPNAMTRDVGTQIVLSTASPSPSWAGRAFVKWNTAADGSGQDYLNTATVTLDGDILLYAQWRGASLISFNANSGVGTPPEAVYHVTNTAYTLPGTALTREGYRFDGWSIGASGTPIHKPGAQVTITGNTTFYARWEKLHRLSYMPNGAGTDPASLPAPSAWTESGGDVAIAQKEPTRPGYEFTGWTLNTAGTGTLYRYNTLNATYEGITGDTPLYAQWIPAETLSFSGNAPNATGLPESVRVVTGGSYAIPAQQPSRLYHIFDGWSLSPSGSGTRYRPGNNVGPINQDTVLYAIWVRQYTIGYEMVNGTPPSPNPFVSKTVNVGDTYVIPNTGDPTLARYAFMGWNTAADGSGTQYASGEAILAVAANITLYAQWAGAEKITLNNNDGTGNATVLRVPTGEDQVLPDKAPVRSGYRFDHWNDHQYGVGTQYQPGHLFTGVAADLDLFARWSKTWRVSYSANGGTGAPASAALDENTPFTLATARPTRQYHTFQGWNTADDGSGQTYSPGDAHPGLAADLALYAQWTREQYTLRYDANGGAGAPANLVAGAGLAHALATQAPSRTGHTFTGWNTAADGTGQSYAPGDTYTLAADGGTLYAQWEVLRFSLRYDANGGKGKPASVTRIAYGTQVKLSSTKPTREGYTFRSWNTADDGKGTSYKPGDTLTIESSVRLYAQWKKVSTSTSSSSSTPAPTPPPDPGPTSSPPGESPPPAPGGTGGTGEGSGGGDTTGSDGPGQGTGSSGPSTSGVSSRPTSASSSGSASSATSRPAGGTSGADSSAPAGEAASAEAVERLLTGRLQVGKTVTLPGVAPGQLTVDPDFFEVSYDADANTLSLTPLKAGETSIGFTDENGEEHRFAAAISEADASTSTGTGDGQGRTLWPLVAGGVVLGGAAIIIPLFILRRRKKKEDEAPL